MGRTHKIVMMEAEAVVDSKGRVTIPKRLRKKLGLREGIR